MKKSILICFFVMITALLWNIKGYAQAGPPTEKGDPPPEAVPLPPDGKHKGLQIDRAALLKSLAVGDSTLNFKELKRDNNMPILVANGTNSSIVEVTGTETNLRKIVYHLPVIPGNNALIKSDFDKIGHLIETVVPRRELINWMVNYYRSLNTAPEKRAIGAYSLIANLLTFDYEPTAKSITFTIATEY